jgi:hypothetical protein
MNKLEDLIGLIVSYDIMLSVEEDLITLKCKIKDVWIEDYYFNENWREPIYIFCRLEPIEDLSKYKDFKDFDLVLEDLNEVSLNSIYKYE